MTQVKKIEESVLVAKLQAKDVQAFEYLYDQYKNAIFGVIYKVISDVDIAEDILQEVFVKIWKNIDSYQSGKGRLYTWMLNIARNRSIDYLRSKEHNKGRQTNSMEASVYAVDAENSTSIAVDHIGIEKFVHQLKKEYQEIIHLAYFMGYTQEEIAKKLEIPLGTVKTRSRTAIRKLREMMAD